jgi:hypothetical protein
MFLVRVELHKATDDDYDTLHDAMEARGFERSVQGSNGTWYQLPTAEYHYSGEGHLRTGSREGGDCGRSDRSDIWCDRR